GLVDAVIVAVPHYQHPVLSIKAMKKGINVVCEKPAGVFTKAVREMNAVADASDVTFAMMFNQRTNCVFRKMKELVDSGKYGEIKRVNWIITDWYRTQAYYDSGAWRATWSGEGGGVLMNQCPHQLDLLQWICGLPVKVTAFCHEGKWHDIEVEDEVTAYLEFENGATGVFITTTGDAPGTNRFEITLDKAKIICEAVGGQFGIKMYELEVGQAEHIKTHPQGFGMPAGKWVDVETDGENLQHVGVLRAFVNHILHGDPLVANGQEGIRGLTLANAMQLSSWTGKTVELPLDEDLFLELLNQKIATSKVKTGASVTFDTEGTY
ncbi:MAG: Gfo/Idh/MocA family oxidoreductase, partial [Oscillospiraceae bacterium]|nr:Gfo/Idh/MocA family oxidoreductase [Oscillospiraceae bacterium]